MSNVLVTGGAGFIGSHLCEALLKGNNRVLVIDNFNNYYDPKIKRNNIEEIKLYMKNDNIAEDMFELIEGDIRDKSSMEQVLNNYIDVVIHLAAMAGVRNSIDNPELYYDVNIMGTLNVLENCRVKHIKKVIFASSSSVYGNNKKVPFSEKDNVDFPISPYAATKKAGELLCHTYHHLYDMSIACLRFFTVYGPRQRPDLAIHKFTKLINEGSPLPFYGDGSTERDYTYIDDIVMGILNSIRWISEDECKYGVFNLGGDHTISLKEMVGIIENAIGKKAKFEYLPMQPGDVIRTCADISHSQKTINYKPVINFRNGVDKFIQWLKVYKEYQ
ncbi:MAG: GDP-mannose 4,6-dehydratase [Bacillota bacterium]|nr:GDP-mannose 4,6-dehydratase [Bacillota bacterium]